MATLPATVTASLPSSLRTLIAGKTEGRYGEGGQLLDVREVWNAPASVTRAQAADARALLAKIEGAQADPKSVDRWLKTLGVLTAKTMTAADAKVRVAAYKPGLVSYPPECFTDETVYRVAKGMTWFPSYAELCAALDKIAENRRETMHRLKMILKAPVSDRPPEEAKGKLWSELTPEQQAEHERLMAPFRSKPAPTIEGESEPLRRPTRNTVLRDGPEKQQAEPVA